MGWTESGDQWPTPVNGDTRGILERDTEGMGKKGRGGNEMRGG